MDPPSAMIGQVVRSLLVGAVMVRERQVALALQSGCWRRGKKKKQKSGTTHAFRGDVLGWNPVNWAMKDEKGKVAEGIALGGGQIKVWMYQGTHRAAQI